MQLISPKKSIFTKIHLMVLILKKGASKKEIAQIEKKLKTQGGIDIMKYCGTLKLKEDALAIQKKLRDEWQ